MSTTPPDRAEKERAARLGGLSEFQWYMSGYGAFSLALGLNGVLLPWMVVVELGESPERLGYIQMASMLPGLCLVLFGGMLADRRELRGHLLRLTLYAAIPPAILIGCIPSPLFSYELLLVYAVVIGSIGAFIMPARDSLLNNVAERTEGLELGQAVTTATFVQFGFQLLGYGLAAAAAIVGAQTLLAGVFISFLASSFCTSQISANQGPNAHRTPRPNAKLLDPERLKSVFHDLSSGLREVWRSKTLFPVITMMFLNGVFGMGVIMVQLPIMIRDIYGGGSTEIAISFTAFFGGVTTIALAMSRRRSPIARQGRVYMLSSFGGVTAMVLIYGIASAAIGFWAIAVAIYFWGLTGGIAMTLGRTIFQENALPSHRARIMSVYSMGFLGGGPLGAVITGYLVRFMGPVDAVLVPAAGMFLVFVVMYRFSSLWQTRRRALQT